MTAKKRTPRPHGNAKGARAAPAASLSPVTAIAFGLVFLFVVLKNAWACDDSYIVFRSIEQLFAGHGPVWNPHERVQAFTSPLWFWLLSIPRMVSHDVYLNALCLSVVFIVLMLVVMRRAFRNDVKLVGAVLALLCCNGFMDFTTSGLENALAYFLIAFYFYHYIALFKDDRVLPTRLALAFGLALVTRHDLLLLFLPSFAYALVVERKRLVARTWLGVGLLAFGPLAAWSVFALVYYGAVFPNTALAKLHAGIPRGALALQGLRYLAASLRYDTIAIVIIIAALFVASRAKAKPWATWLAFGVIANIAYVVSIGGDFMLGRFLSFAYLMCVMLLLGNVDLRSRTLAANVGGIVLVIYMLAYPHTPFKTGRSFSNEHQYHGIADERGVYFNATSIYKYTRYKSAPSGTKLPYFPNQSSARKGYEIGQGPYGLTDSKMIGFFGYCAGTRMTVVDRMGLSDPLLARLPAAERKNWRIGHFFRAEIPGYYESIATGEPKIKDAQLNEFYKKLKIVTQGPVFSSERFKTIVALNTGQYDHYLSSFPP